MHALSSHLQYFFFFFFFFSFRLVCVDRLALSFCADVPSIQEMGNGVSLCTVYLNQPRPGRTPPLTRFFPVAERVSFPMNSRGSINSLSSGSSNIDSNVHRNDSSSVHNDHMNRKNGIRIGYGIVNEGGPRETNTSRAGTDQSATVRSHLLRAFACPSEWGGQRGAACSAPSFNHILNPTPKHVVDGGGGSTSTSRTASSTAITMNTASASAGTSAGSSDGARAVRDTSENVRPVMLPTPRSLLASWSDPRGPMKAIAVNSTVVCDFGFRCAFFNYLCFDIKLEKLEKLSRPQCLFCRKFILCFSN